VVDQAAARAVQGWIHRMAASSPARSRAGRPRVLVHGRRHAAACLDASGQPFCRRPWVSAALLLFGRKPFNDFLFYQVPAIACGSALGFNNDPQWIPTNYGVYGRVAKLRLLGVAGMTQATGNVVAAAYGVVLLAIVVVLLVRARHPGPDLDDPISGSPLVWLSLLNLAAVRSPYVGDGYAQVVRCGCWRLSHLSAVGRARHSWALQWYAR
jgi:hypothetical protein